MTEIENILSFVKDNALPIFLVLACIYGVSKVVKTTLYFVIISIVLIMVASYFGYNYSSIKDTVIMFFN